MCNRAETGVYRYSENKCPGFQSPDTHPGLPQLVASGAGSPFATGGTVLGNIAVGTLYGWCYWKRSLIAAMAAHFAVDFMIHVLPAFG